MKKLMVLGIGLLMAGAGQAQQLQGSFVTDIPKGTVSFEHHFYWFEKGRFIHTEEGCTGSSYGAGSYQLRTDSLWLHFDGPPVLLSSITPDSTHATSGVLSIQVLDLLTKQPISSAEIVYTRGPIQVLNTNMSGHISLPRPPAANEQLIIRADNRAAIVFTPQANCRHYTAQLAPARPVERYEAGTTQLKLIKLHTNNQLRWCAVEALWDSEFKVIPPTKATKYLALYKQLSTNN